MVLPLGARKIQRYHKRIPVYEPLVDSFYVWGDDVPVAQDPTVAVELDPLASTEKILPEDTISENLELLVVSGVPSEKIIAGLSTWARSYRLKKASEFGHRAPIWGIGLGGNETKRTDGRLAYQEVRIEIYEPQLRGTLSPYSHVSGALSMVAHFRYSIVNLLRCANNSKRTTST